MKYLKTFEGNNASIITVQNCAEDSVLFRRGNIHNDRLKYVIGDYKLSLLEQKNRLL